MSSHITYKEAAPGAGVKPDHPAEQGYRVEVLDGLTASLRVTDGQGGDASPRKKFAICGFAASSRNLAPFDDPEWEIWGLNQLYRHIPRATRWFDIHANWREDNVDGTDHPRWLRESGIPVYMSVYEPSIPTCVQFPLERVKERVTGVDYFTSTVAYMVSYAILLADEQVDAELRGLRDLSTRATVPLEDDPDLVQRVEHARAVVADPFALRKWTSDRYAERAIALYGIDLIVGKEFDFQKACVEFLLGLAQARNITIHLPEACSLLKQRWRYGYETEPGGQFVKLDELARRTAALQGEKQQLLARLNTVDGALQNNEFWRDVAELRSRSGVVVVSE